MIHFQSTGVIHFQTAYVTACCDCVLQGCSPEGPDSAAHSPARSRRRQPHQPAQNGAALSDPARTHKASDVRLHTRGLRQHGSHKHPQGKCSLINTLRVHAVSSTPSGYVQSHKHPQGKCSLINTLRVHAVS